MAVYKATVPQTASDKIPPVGFHFMVTFFRPGRDANNMDIRFQRVSGIACNVQTSSFTEGGLPRYNHKVPTHLEYDNLVLERGMLIGSKLYAQFHEIIIQFKFYPCDVLVTLLDEKSQPLTNWVFYRAYPVRWSISDLDAEKNGVLIDTMELAYSYFRLTSL